MQVSFYSITDLFWQFAPVVAVIAAGLLYWLACSFDKPGAQVDGHEYDWTDYYAGRFPQPTQRR